MITFVHKSRRFDKGGDKGEDKGLKTAAGAVEDMGFDLIEWQS